MSHLPGLPHPGAPGDGPRPAVGHELVMGPHSAPPLPGLPPALIPDSGHHPRRPERSPFSPTSLLYAYLRPDEDPWKPRRRRDEPLS